MMYVDVVALGIPEVGMVRAFGLERETGLVEREERHLGCCKHYSLADMIFGSILLLPPCSSRRRWISLFLDKKRRCGPSNGIFDMLSIGPIAS